MPDDQFLTTEEVIDYLNVNLRTIYRLIKAGKLPAVRIGRQWRFRRADLDAWLARNQPDASGEGPRSRVLVVDDEISICELVSRALQDASYDVDTVQDGPAAVERLDTGGYDLIITDLKMPGMDGLSVIREIRRRASNIPVIIITANSTEASAIEAINLGVSGYLTKPFRMPRVVATAARALGQAPAA